MRIGLFGINMHDLAGPGALAAVARHAEAAGIESLWAGEHQVFPTAPLARQLQSPTDPILDPLLALTFAAAVTERLVLATGILLLPLRHPVTLAKELATLDVLSAGRLVVGVGIGYLDVELAALGVSARERVPRAVEHLAAMRALWSMPEPHFEGRYVRFEGVDAYPRPLRPGGPPVVFGGHAPGALQRAARYGDGWYGFLLDPAGAATAVNELARLVDVERGPSASHFEITVTPSAPLDEEAVEAYTAAGVDRVAVWPQEARSVEDWLRAVDRLAPLVEQAAEATP